ncbi:hypothetical protein [Halomonas denitrificans]|nr:hypothetical protein [Halomonas denitrificans]
MTAQLLVALPVLDDVLDGRLEAPPGLARLLGFGRIERGGGDAALAAALGQERIPAAGPRATLAAGETDTAGSAWLRVEPVHLQPDLTAVWLRQAAALDWSAPSMAPLHDALHELFDRPGLAWYPPTNGVPGRIRVAEAPQAAFVPLHAAVGRRLDETLPRGPDAARWHALINESQMIFHQFRALDDPRSAGLGLWFWGAGSVPARPDPSPVARVIVAGDRTEGEGLARWLDVDADFLSEQEPDRASNNDHEYGPEGRLHPTGTTLVEATLGADAPDRLVGLDRCVFEPAWRALRSGRLGAVRLIGSERTVGLRRWSPFAFWRRPFSAEAVR